MVFCSFQSKDRVNLTFETMFETGVDEMSWDDVVRPRRVKQNVLVGGGMIL